MHCTRPSQCAATRMAGFTLTELGCTVAVLAVLCTLAAPAFRELLLDARRSREINQFVLAVHLARSEAMKRNAVISLCPSSDAASCGGASTPWHAGWLLFVNDDRDTPAVRDGLEALLRIYPAWAAGSVYANRSTLSFRPFGQSGTTATLTFCDQRGVTAARAVIISQTGRPRIAERSASGTPLRCAP